MKTAKYLVLCSRKDGIGGSALHFTSQLKVKSIKQLFSMFIKVRHTPKSDFEIKFYVGRKGKIQPYSVFGDKQQTSADFKLINDCTPRKFFNKQRMETTLRNIAKRDKYFVKRNDWWRPPKVVYKKRHYRLCKTRRFTAEQLAPLAKTFGKEGAYLYRDAIPRIVAEFLRKKWFPTPNLESRVYAFKHLFWDFYEAVLLVTKIEPGEILTKQQDESNWSLFEACRKMKTFWYQNPKMVDLICAKLSKLNNGNIVNLRITNPGKVVKV